jgi:hypothetical protein
MDFAVASGENAVFCGTFIGCGSFICDQSGVNDTTMKIKMLPFIRQSDQLLALFILSA